MIKASLDLRLGGGAVIAVPIPAEHEAAGMEVEASIHEALAEAKRCGVAGAEVRACTHATKHWGLAQFQSLKSFPPSLLLQVTPFLLERIRATTGGKSLAANIALVKCNAAVGAAIAVQLAALEQH